MSDELTILRTSIKRVAEMTQDAQVIAAIPEGDELNAHPYSERGWNRLCVVLCDWIEQCREKDAEITHLRIEKDAEITYLRIDNARLRDEAAIRNIAPSIAPDGDA